MKSFALGFVLLLTAAANATEIKIYEGIPEKDYVKEVKFAFNQELGRAWVEVVEESKGSDDIDTTSITRVKVPGLSFDAATNTVVLEHEGQLVECAKLITRGRSIFRLTNLVNERCSLTRKTVKVLVDDGFFTSKEKRVQAFLNVE